MDQVKAKVLSNIELLRYKEAQYFLMELFADRIPHQSKPGQFIMISCGEEALLRRPISIHSVTSDNTLQLLYACASNDEGTNKNNMDRETEIRVSRGIGTNWLSKLRRDAELDIIGPLGNGFKIHDESKSVLLVAGGIGIAPLKYLAENALSAGKNVTLLMGARTGDGLYPSDMLPSKLNTVITTDDGSRGIKSPVISLIPEYISWADQVFACGPNAMYTSMKDQMQKCPVEKSFQVSLEVRMGCGFGVCYCCSIKTKQGIKRVCKEGPVFNIKDIIWQEVKI